MLTKALTAPRVPARFTTAEFAWVCERDAFGDIKVELIEGVLHRLPLNMNAHAAMQVQVEIAEGTFDRDYGLKQRLYSAAGVPNSWVIDLMRRVVHVFDRPSDNGYLGVGLVRFGEPLAVPGSEATITLD